jgi:hypothetical protein
MVTQIAAYQVLHAGSFPEAEYLAGVVENPITARMNLFGRIALPTKSQLDKFRKKQEKGKDGA